MHEADVARVLALAERVPVGVLRRPRRAPCRSLRLGRFSKSSSPKNCGTGVGDERRVRHRRDRRALLQERDVLRAGAEVVVGDDRAVRACRRTCRTPPSTPCGRGRTSGSRASPRSPRAGLPSRQLRSSILMFSRKSRAVDEELEPAPRRLQLLEVGVVQDLGRSAR